MELKIDNWNNVSITNWRRIKDVLTDESLDDISKNVALLSILCDVDENVIWDLNVNELEPLISKIGWLGKFDFPKDVKFRKMKIGDIRCTIDTDLQNMTVAQYVDFQNLYKDFDKNVGAILACFIIPEGRKYGEGYDTVEFAQRIEDNISIVQSNAICFFFLKNWAISIRAMQICLEFLMKRMKRKYKGQMTEVERKYKEMMAMYGSLL